MEKSSIILMVIFVVVFIVSGANCNEYETCLNLNDECFNGDDCCSKVCRRSINIFYKYCKEPNFVFEALTNLVLPKAEEGKCAYSTNKSEQMNNKQYRPFGINAGHATLLPGTIVEVTYNNAKEFVTIKHHLVNRDDIILDLNTEAALVLGITKEGVVPCSVRVPFMENHVFIKDIFYYIPYVSVIACTYLISLILYL